MANQIYKVLIISTTSFELDGITNVILNYFRAMDRSDIQIDFVVPNDLRIDLKKELEKEGSHIYKISERNKKTLSYVNKLYKVIRDNKYDIVHAHGNSCTLGVEMYAAKRGGAKVRIAHSHNSTCRHKFLHIGLRKLFDNSYTNAFACGEKAGRWLYRDRPFQIINNGIDIDKYKYDDKIREKYRSKYDLNGKKVVGHVGHFTYQKNHEYLIEVFNELYKLDNRYRLMLVGDGELREEINEKAKETGLSKVVIFTGTTLEVPQLMQAMDMIIMPSRFEGVPLTLVEAQVACLPCFVSDAISKEVAISELVKFITLDKSPKVWAQEINYSISKQCLDREIIKDSVYSEIVHGGYSINDNAIKMKELYKIYVKQVKN